MSGKEHLTGQVAIGLGQPAIVIFDAQVIEPCGNWAQALRSDH